MNQHYQKLDNLKEYMRYFINWPSTAFCVCDSQGNIISDEPVMGKRTFENYLKCIAVKEAVFASSNKTKKE